MRDMGSLSRRSIILLSPMAAGLALVVGQPAATPRAEAGAATWARGSLTGITQPRPVSLAAAARSFPDIRRTCCPLLIICGYASVFPRAYWVEIEGR